MPADAALLERIEEPVYHARADRSDWDFHNLFVMPFRELFHYKELVRNIVSRDLKVRYKRSLFGIAWTVLAPTMTMLVLWAVFTKAMGVQIPNYATYLLSGLICWNFFTQTSASGGAAILGARDLVCKVRLPRVVFPISAAFNNLVNFAFACVALVLTMLLTRSSFHLTLFLFPVMILPMFLFAAGWAMLVSALSVFFRDLQYILEIVLQAAFYVTPILYRAESVPEKYRWIVSINPLAKFIHLFRLVAYDGLVPGASVYFVSLFTGAAMFLLGWYIFHRLQKKFIYYL